MPSRSPESVENGLETETTKNEIEQSIAVETETQKNTKCNCFNFKSFAKRGCRTLVRQPLFITKKTEKRGKKLTYDTEKAIMYTD